MKLGITTFIIFTLLSANINASKGQSVKFENTRIEFSLPDGWALGEVAGIVKRDNGNFIVFHRGHHQLIEFDPNYNFLREIGLEMFENPHGLRLDQQGNIWTTDSSTHIVLRFSPSGDVTMVLGKNRTAGTGWFDRDYNLVLFDQPMDVAFDRFNNIYVVDRGNTRIVKLNPDGLLIKTWGQAGTELGEFNFPHSIVIDKQDHIYIADRENKRIQIFDLNGQALGQWSDVGYPYVLALSTNTLWMTDARAEKVRQFNFDGELLASYQGDKGRNPGQFSAVHGLHVEAENSIWVTQIFNWGGVNMLSPIK